jgi:DnaA family protein
MQCEPERGGRRPPSPQLALPVGLDDEATLDNFLPRDALAVPAAAARAAPTAEPLSFLHGAAESGKSHLLQALCHAHPRAVYLPLASRWLRRGGRPVAGPRAGAAAGPRRRAGDCRFAPAGKRRCSTSCNRARASGLLRAVGAGRRPPGIWASSCRISAPGWPAASPGRCRPASDTEKAGDTALSGAAPGPETLRMRWPLPDRPRQPLPRDLLACLDRLDAASLQLQRPLTMPLVKQRDGLVAAAPPAFRSGSAGAGPCCS